jgi:predicted GNAT family acetyltransferase
MDKIQYVKLRCTKRTFRPILSEKTRWWAKDDWREHRTATYPPFLAHHKKTWDRLYRQGYRFCATLKKGRIIAAAGLWPRYKDCWEVIAVGVKHGMRSKGLGRAIVAFVTDEILKTGRMATLTTNINNIAMQRAARAVGFKTIRKQRTRN